MTHKTDDAEIAAFTRHAVMLILHIMRNLRTTGMDVDLDIELSYPQILALYALLEKGTCTMSELSKWLKISHGVATRTVDRLVDKGMVERKHGSEDRRVVLVSLSPEGADHAEKMITYHLEEMNKVFGRVPPSEREGFVRLLSEIDEQLEK
jgi:DNA-binding MarR family transcriptional regulator